MFQDPEELLLTAEFIAKEAYWVWDEDFADWKGSDELPSIQYWRQLLIHNLSNPFIAVPCLFIAVPCLDQHSPIYRISVSFRVSDVG